MSKIDYDHAQNLHTADGARAGFKYIRRFIDPKSLLDVGAGTGSWLKAAIDVGITDVQGVDGVRVDQRQLDVDPSVILERNLEKPFDLGRVFDVALCLEVAEHLSSEAAPPLVACLCKHAPVVFFSGAIPRQNGQNHINCQWPDYWQSIFNANGFVCDDAIRLAMWNDSAVEPWYRQNIFRAVKADDQAGHEPRLLPLVHPEMIRFLELSETPIGQLNRDVLSARLPARTYIKLAVKSLGRQLGLSS